MPDYFVELQHINKSFSGIKALDDVPFQLKRGEILALLGENGAGKSTLMKILSGIYQRDSGTITIDGENIQEMTPKRAKALGIAIIHQELNMCNHLTVAENIFLGRESVRSLWLDNETMQQKTQAILKHLNIDLSPDALVGDLSVSKQQMVEIAKALSMDARILIMDEPTSALSPKEIANLFSIIRKLKEEGCSIIYISHRLEELKHLVDRVTIMRDGHFITSMDFASTTMDEIITHMVGREITETYPHVNCTRGKKLLEVRHLSAGHQVQDVSFDLYAGEIVGIAGLMGAGRTEMLRALFGADPKDSGNIRLNGEEITINSPRDAIAAGIVLAPEDRKHDGLCTKLSIRENISLPNLDFLASRFGWVEHSEEKALVSKIQKRLRIKMADPETNAEKLSGGNQQKIVIGKWLSRSSRIVLFDEPTRGIDVAAKTEIYHLLNELKCQGIGVLFVSSAMPEVMGVADRILVMCDGRITGELLAKEATQPKIMHFATRFKDKMSVANAIDQERYL